MNAEGLLKELQELQSHKDEAERLRLWYDNQKVFLVTVPEANAATVETFDTLEALIQVLKTRLGSRNQVFIFHGSRLGITKGPFRHLVTPDGNRLPLFDTTDDDLDPDGWLYETPEESLPIDPLPPPVLIPSGT